MRRFETEFVNGKCNSCGIFFELYEMKSSHPRLEDIDALLDTCEGLLQEEKEILASMHDIVDSLGIQSTSLALAQKKTPQPNIIVRPMTALERVTEAADKCKSRAVAERFSPLNQRLYSYLTENSTEDDLVKRLNNYYLPTLEIAFQNLAAAESKRLKKTVEREKLCLQAISIVEEVLLPQEDAADDADLMDLRAEIQTMENMAKLKGDISSSVPSNSFAAGAKLRKEESL